MPLIIDGGRVPPRWGEKTGAGRILSAHRNESRNHGISLALINNMPDAALEDTELQFFELLDIASGDVPVFVKLYSLNGIPRTDRGDRHLNSFYWGMDDLWNSRFDGVIMTGTEPRSPDLRNEPYWRILTEVLDWAERNTASTILSCLAAHAGVLHSDGIPRHPLRDKQFGVFDFKKSAEHPLTSSTPQTIRFSHSRWNEVRADELTASGYVVLTQSAEGGVDSFVKKKKQSLFVHFQGHPEYGAHTLLKEYRRDIKRFLRRERETYPTMPQHYFDAAAETLLADFRATAETDRREEDSREEARREELMDGFPEAAVAGTLQKSWHSSATAIYSNWLQYVVEKKCGNMTIPAGGSLHDAGSSKRSALR